MSRKKEKARKELEREGKKDNACAASMYKARLRWLLAVKLYVEYLFLKHHLLAGGVLGNL
jgi:hypothetical protein